MTFQPRNSNAITTSAPAAAPAPTGTMDISNFEDLMKMSNFLAASDLIPYGLRKKPADVAVVLMTGKELGLSPMQALGGISVINGKPTADSQLALAMIRSKIDNPLIRIESFPDQKMVRVTMARDAANPVDAYEAEWDLKRAEAMGLTKAKNNNESMYKTQPMTMLKWRAVMDAARTVFSDVIKGMYSDDEANDIATPPAPPTDKGADLTSRVVGSQPKVEPKPVENEMVDVDAEHLAAGDPEVIDGFMSDASNSTYDPLGEYVIQVNIGKLKGLKLNEVPRHELIELANLIEKKQRASGEPLTGQWLELVTRIRDYDQSRSQPTLDQGLDFGAMG